MHDVRFPVMVDRRIEEAVDLKTTSSEGSVSPYYTRAGHR